MHINTMLFLIFHIISIIALIIGVATVLVGFLLTRKYEDKLLKEYFIILIVIMAGYLHEPISYYVSSFLFNIILNYYYSISMFVLIWRLIHFTAILLDRKILERYNRIIIIFLIFTFTFSLIITGSNIIIIIVITEVIFYLVLLLTLVIINRNTYRIKMKSVAISVGLYIKILLVFLPIFIVESLFLLFMTEDYEIKYLSLPHILFILLWNVMNMVLISKYFFKPISEKNNIDINRDFLKEYGITPTEMEIIKLIKNGLSNKEIAFERQSKEKTIKNHVYNIYQKLEIRSRVELINLLNSYL